MPLLMAPRPGVCGRIRMVTLDPPATVAVVPVGTKALALAAMAAVGFQLSVLDAATGWLRKLPGKKAWAWAWVIAVGGLSVAIGVPGLVELASRGPATPAPALPPLPTYGMPLRSAALGAGSV